MGFHLTPTDSLNTGLQASNISMTFYFQYQQISSINSHWQIINLPVETMTGAEEKEGQGQSDVELERQFI